MAGKSEMSKEQEKIYLSYWAQTKKEVAEEVINQIDSTFCFNNKGVMCQECRYSRVTFNSKKVKQYNGPIVYCTLHKEFVPHGDSCISFDKKY